MMTEQKVTESSGVQEINLELCEVHPIARLRMSYDDIDKLAEDIGRNGQLQEGMGVMRLDGKGVWIYMGVRRLYACKKLYRERGKLTHYRVRVDANVTDEQIRTRILAENCMRKDLSLLEELKFVASMFEASYREDQAERVMMQAGMDGVPLRLHLAKELSTEDIDGLFKIEHAHNLEKHEDGKDKFKFSITHISNLWQWCDGDKKTFLIAAAAVAYGEWKVKDLDKEFALITLAKQPNNIKWVTKLFPDLALPPIDKEQLDRILKGDAPEPDAKTGGGTTGDAPEPDPLKGGGGAPQPNALKGGSGGTPEVKTGGGGSSITKEAIEGVVKDAIWLVCPHCHKSGPFEYQRPKHEKHSLTQIGFKEDGTDKSDKMELEIECKPVTKKCKYCSEEFTFKLAPQGRNVVATIFEEALVAAKAKEETLTPHVLAYSNDLAAAGVCQGWYAIQHDTTQRKNFFFVYSVSGELRAMTAAEKVILDGKQEQATSRELSESSAENK